MAAESELAGLFVRIYGKGVDKLQATLGGIKGMAERAQSSLDKFAGGAARLAGVLGVGGGIFGYFAKGAMEGTVEAERLEHSFEILQRIVGAGLAPYVRTLTQGILELAKWWSSLNQATKDSITKWATITAAVVSFIAILGAVAIAISSVVGALASIATAIASVLGPWGILVAVVIAAAAAIAGGLLHISSEGDNFADRTESMLQRVYKLWMAWQVGMTTIFKYIEVEWSNLTGLLEKGTNFTPRIALAEAIAAGISAKADATRQAETFNEKLKELKNQWNAAIAAIAKAGRTGPGTGFTRGEARIESSQARYDRLLMDAISGRLGTDEQQLDTLIKINERFNSPIGVNVVGMPAMPVVR